jgi:hypothetical protein
MLIIPVPVGRAECGLQVGVKLKDMHLPQWALPSTHKLPVMVCQRSSPLNPPRLGDLGANAAC